MLDLANSSLASAGRRPSFPANQLRFEQKGPEVTVVVTFEIASNEVRDEVERNVADALSALALGGRLETSYEAIR